MLAGGTLAVVVAGNLNPKATDEHADPAEERIDLLSATWLSSLGTATGLTGATSSRENSSATALKLSMQLLLSSSIMSLGARESWSSLGAAGCGSVMNKLMLRRTSSATSVVGALNGAVSLCTSAWRLEVWCTCFESV